MNKKISVHKGFIAVLIGVLMCVAFGFTVQTARAQTSNLDALRAQVQQLMEIVAQLQAQLAVLRGDTMSIDLGAEVMTTEALKVRSVVGTAGTLITVAPVGSRGEVIAGPRTANDFTWYQIAYDSGVTGWSAENWLRVVTKAPAVTSNRNPKPAPSSIVPPVPSTDYIDIMDWDTFHGSSDHTHEHQLAGGRTPITTEALVAYNGLRTFFGLPAVDVETVGEWAFDNGLTNNTQAWENDIKGVGLWYAMQGAKVAWIAEDAYDPQIMADVQRTARLGETEEVLDMIVTYGHDGLAAYLAEHELEEAFINTLKMEPHYGGWMHGRTHGWRDIEGVATAHDVNHLTVLSHDQQQSFMNDTFDWPQWPALEVSDAGVIAYFTSMVFLGEPS